MCFAVKKTIRSILQVLGKASINSPPARKTGWKHRRHLGKLGQRFERKRGMQCGSGGQYVFVNFELWMMHVKS